MTCLTLRWHAEELAVAILPADARVPAFEGVAIHGELRTTAGKTIIFPRRYADQLGPEARTEGPFHALEVDGPLDFSLTGILTSVLNPLAVAEINIFTLSTFDTDWVLVPVALGGKATGVLTAAGHTVLNEEALT